MFHVVDASQHGPSSRVSGAGGQQLSSNQGISGVGGQQPHSNPVSGEGAGGFPSSNTAGEQHADLNSGAMGQQQGFNSGGSAAHTSQPHSGNGLAQPVSADTSAEVALINAAAGQQQGAQHARGHSLSSISREGSQHGARVSPSRPYHMASR